MRPAISEEVTPAATARLKRTIPDRVKAGPEFIYSPIGGKSAIEWKIAEIPKITAAGEISRQRQIEPAEAYDKTSHHLLARVLCIGSGMTKEDFQTTCFVRLSLKDGNPAVPPN